MGSTQPSERNRPPVILVSPTEPELLRRIGRVSSKAEEYGADVLMVVKGEIVAVQRKEVKDWVSSINNGMLAKELEKMKWADRRVLVLEGKMTFNLDGNSTVSRGMLTKKMHLGILFSLQEDGVWLIGTDTLADTIIAVHSLEVWLGKSDHKGLSRPKPKGKWGNVSSREWGVHFLCGIDTIGKELAGRIYDHYAGVPIKWTTGVREMTTIAGIGTGTAKRILACLSPVDDGLDDNGAVWVLDPVDEAVTDGVGLAILE